MDTFWTWLFLLFYFLSGWPIENFGIRDTYELGVYSILYMQLTFRGLITYEECSVLFVILKVI